MAGHNKPGRALTVFDTSDFHEEPDYRSRPQDKHRPNKAQSDPSAIFTDDEVAAALHEAGGLHFLAAQVLGRGCTGASIRRRINRTPYLQQILMETQGDIGDRAELAVFKGIRENKLDAAKFYLQTRGKDRGYTTKAEDNTLPSSATPSFDLSRLSPEQLATLLKTLNSPDPTPHTIDADFEEVTK